MVKDSTPLTRFFLIISIIMGCLVSFKISVQPVSKSMTELRICLIVAALFVLIFGLLGIYLVRRINMNEEYMLNENDDEYYQYLESNFKYYLSFSPLVALIMLGITFILPFHIGEMTVTLSIFYFAICFFQVVPFFDIVYTIINAIRYSRG